MERRLTIFWNGSVVSDNVYWNHTGIGRFCISTSWINARGAYWKVFIRLSFEPMVARPKKEFPWIPGGNDLLVWLLLLYDDGFLSTLYVDRSMFCDPFRDGTADISNGTLDDTVICSGVSGGKT